MILSETVGIKENFPRYKVPQARRPIHSVMESDNMNLRSRSSRNQNPTIGWRYGSNEELNRSEYESDDENIDLHTSSDSESYGWKKKPTPRNFDLQQNNMGYHEGKSYGLISPDGKLSYIPESAVFQPAGRALNTSKIADMKKQVQHKNKPLDSIANNANKKYSPQSNNWMYIVIPFLMVSVIAFFNLYVNSESVEKKTRLRDDIKNIRSEFPSQENDIWYKFSSGIIDVEGNPSRPSVFLILYDRADNTPSCLAMKIAKAAMHFLNSTKSGPLVLDGVELGKNMMYNNDYGELIAEKKLKVEEHRTVIIKNLHKVPGKVAQSFHSLCDRHTPLVDKAVYLFTLKASGIHNVERATALAEEELERSWKKDINEDVLKPLITRITDNVVVVKSEPRLPSCRDVV
ncbi:hypothetical protein L9F63_025697 [Diploptera punctata]|uniref:Uncharacterized protein n=1 Tax=Diploptera punctata TaxID=6984 RepID=A0AAD8E390_DIPPU|nr:hypothetical protein L9F63_025697 [Diploptera punctata]